MTRDLKIWLEHLVEEGAQWTPERFEFAFGLIEHTPAAIRAQHRRSRRTSTAASSLRGSIDLVERHRKTGFLRVTDHKTGRNRTNRGETVVDGGRVLQPVIYGLALEALLEPDQTVLFRTAVVLHVAGGFTQHEIPLLDDTRRRGLEVLEIIDRAIEARHARGAAGDATRAGCCDFEVVCGRQEERRTGRKARELFADLMRFGKMP